MSLAGDIRYAADVLRILSAMKASGSIYQIVPPPEFTVEESCRYDVGVVMRLKRAADQIDQNMARLSK